MIFPSGWIASSPRGIDGLQSWISSKFPRAQRTCHLLKRHLVRGPRLRCKGAFRAGHRARLALQEIPIS
jgi:hypothetical protein